MLPVKLGNEKTNLGHYMPMGNDDLRRPSRKQPRENRAGNIRGGIRTYHLLKEVLKRACPACTGTRH
jgi:hypothetical protein